MNKNAETDHPIHNTLAVRWSPYVFSAKPVAITDLRSLFEAARWAPSSYNEQPWRYIVGLKGEGETHRRILDCLAEGNQPWARNAPVLALGVVMRNFSANGKPNKAAPHDLGLATGNLVTEATTRRLYVHQMIGLDPEAAREAFSIPEDAEAFTAIAIGYREAAQAGDSALHAREDKQRTRRPLGEFVFTGNFGDPAGF
ncbi:nitroreductase [Salinisphaera orenii MK-B5]|uniref:Nitroreductase n=1 Tax=Salinisphaera orenii MK-B5 TaxID=856730 RepID=A0A423PMD6_9GAMM|nr:nitroreductase family protein [Salinisphaera orenii]ROO26661.1 nitroreductase [Salinisphaera orenii MK-B5]